MKTELHFWELPNKAMFWLDTNFWQRLYNYKRNKKLSWRDIAGEIVINSGTLQNYISQFTQSKKSQYIPFKTLLKISYFLKISPPETEKFIIKTKYGKNGKPIKISFPINFLAPEWAGLIGAVLAEGNINSHFTVGFWNKDNEVLNNFIELAKKIISNDIRINKNVYGCFFPAIFGQILVVGLELEVGNKTKSDIVIPEIYLNSKDKQITRYLLSWLFTGDGWVTIFKDHLGQTHRAIGIGFGSLEKDKQPQLLRGIMHLLDQLEIKYSKPYQEIKRQKSGKITYSWKIFIKGKQNLSKFSEQVSFQNSKKQKILEHILQTYKKPKLGNGESVGLVLSAIKKLYASGKAINKNSIAELIHLNPHWVTRLLIRAKEKGIVKVIGGGERMKGKWGGRNPYLYKLSKKG